MDVKRVVYLTDVPFTARDDERLGAGFFRREGLPTEVFGLSAVLRPETAVGGEESDESVVRSFLDLDDALEAVASLDETTLVINLLPRSAATRPLASALRASPAPVAEVRTNATPAGRPSLRRRLARLTPGRVKNAVVRAIWPLVARRPDIIIYGGEASRPAAHEARALVSAHALDYDAFFRLPDPVEGGGERYAVFVDQNLPGHPDFALLGQKAPVAAGEYYPAMRRFFTSLEEHLGLPVVIAAHPRASAEETGVHFGGRRVAAGNTASLVRGASLALLHYSTALNFAVLGNVPMIFVETAGMRRSCAPLVHAMAAMTGRPVLLADAPPQTWDPSVLEVRADGYAAYSRRYIKESGTPEAPFWRILLDAARRLPPARTSRNKHPAAP